ncbi:hypothetical protein TeGR_g11623, partial [Tetraparma gracilis]
IYIVFSNEQDLAHASDAMGRKTFEGAPVNCQQMTEAQMRMALR